MPESIEAKEHPIRHVFGDAYRFEIPKYQRPYVWTTEQAGELLDDLLHAVDGIQESEEVEKASPYFMGSMVVIKKNNSPLADIVDGQQRITTLTMMFCALRELADPKDQNTLNNYICETSDKYAGIKGHYRVTLRNNNKDDNFFKDKVQEQGKLPEFVKHGLDEEMSASQQRMFENARLLYNKLSRLTIRRREVLTSFLVQRCYLVIVAVSDQEFAYRIFTVMNDRGLDLSPTDILKSQIIGSMDDDVQSEQAEAWEDIEGRLGRDRFKDLFSHIRMIYLKTKLHETLQQDFQRKILNGIDGAKFINEILVPHSDAYEAITQASYQSTSDGDRVNGLLRSLNRLDNFDWIPSAMVFFRNNSDDADTLIRFVCDLERLAYGLFLIRANVNERISRYANVLSSIERGDDLYRDTSSLQLSSQQKTKILSALDSQIYGQGQMSRVAKPLLLRLDALLTDAGATYDPQKISIEHVLPRNPAAGSEWMTSFTNDQRREWTGKLANLVLLSHNKNSRAQNYDFARKKTEYFQGKRVTTFALTTQVVRESEWTPEVLERRQRNLIGVLSEEWRLGE